MFNFYKAFLKISPVHKIFFAFTYELYVYACNTISGVENAKIVNNTPCYPWQIIFYNFMLKIMELLAGETIQQRREAIQIA